MKRMKYSLVLITLFFFIAKTYAGDTLYYVGHIIPSNSVKVGYILRFTYDSSMKVTGYSLADADGPFETKTKITGTYDSTKKKLFFTETKILRTKIDTVGNKICFVKGELKFSKNKYTEELAGDFKGFEIGTTSECSKGEVKLINTNRIKKIFTEQEQKEIEKEKKELEKAEKKQKKKDARKKKKEEKKSDS